MAEEVSNQKTKAPGFLDWMKIVWLVTVSKNQDDMYIAAVGLHEYVESKSYKYNSNPKDVTQEELNEVAVKGQFATVLFQNAGKFDEAAISAINLISLSKKVTTANPDIKMNMNQISAAHAGAWSAVVAYHEHKGSASQKSWLDAAENLSSDAMKMVFKPEVSDLRKAGLLGTLALIKFSGGNKSEAIQLLKDAEELNKGQLRKEVSANWPKPAGQFIPKAWDELVDSVSNTIYNKKAKVSR